jgi:hypothetical protein
MIRGRALTTLLFVALLSLLAADISIGCGSQAYVFGTVTQKYVVSGEASDRFILVEGQSYAVPWDFYNKVQIGDVVRFNGHEWSIVQRGGVPVTPTSLP